MRSSGRALRGLLAVALVGCGAGSSPGVDLGAREGIPPRVEATAAACRDGADNDGDGFVDCADQDCWPLVACQTDGGAPDDGSADGLPPGDGPSSGADGNVGDGPRGDGGLQACAIHWDCVQGEFCYKGSCLRDRQAVFHCGKPGCPPGQWCLTQSNAKGRCAEDPAFVCQTACDCGPAHCCLNNRCVRDLGDPWLTGPVVGTSPPGSCKRGADATYCCAAPECYAGWQAYGVASPSFRCHSPDTQAAAATCGGRPCFGSACGCAAGEACVDVAHDPPMLGAGCLLFSGGACVSTALAEAVYGFAAADLLPCCGRPGRPAGSPCDLGWRSGGAFTYERVVATAGSCGDGVCDAGEYPERCVDCRDPQGQSKLACGDGRCEPGEDASSCAADCSCNHNGRCEPWEFAVAAACAADCPTAEGDCVDAKLFAGQHQICGDGVCDAGSCPQGPESCRTCPQDCGLCEWQVVHGEDYSWGARQPLYGAWAGAGDDFFAVGAGGTILRRNGVAWTLEPSGTEHALRGMWRVSSSSLFVVGDGGVILHHDGARWKQMSSGTTQNLTAVWGSDPTNVIAVGSAGTIRRYDGAAWSPMSAGTKALLYGAWGSAADALFVVGRDLSSAQSELWRYDGKAWTLLPLPANTPALYAVWGSSASDVYAVGSSGTIVRYDGAGVDVLPAVTTSWLASVWGSSASDVYAVGSMGAVLHYDGSTWSTEWSPAWAAATQLRAVRGNAAGSVLAVGDGGTIIERVAGAWTAQNDGGRKTLHGVWCSPTGAVFAVGRGGLVLRHDGGPWVPQQTNELVTLRDVWGRSVSDVYAVGEYGRVLHYDGNTLSRIPWSGSAELFSVWGSAAGSELFVAGQAGVIARYDGATFKTLTSGTSEVLEALWGRSPTDLYAAGRGGTVLRFDGGSWSSMASGVTADIHDLAGNGGPEIFAVGASGTILRHDGSAWSELALPTSGVPLGGVWVTASGEIFAVGSAGTIVHFDGTVATRVRADLRDPGGGYGCRSLGDISGGANGELFAVGEGELVVRRCAGAACTPPAP